MWQRRKKDEVVLQSTQQKPCCAPGVPAACPTPELQGQGWHLGLLCCSLGDEKHEMGQKRVIRRGVPVSLPGDTASCHREGWPCSTGTSPEVPSLHPACFNPLLFPLLVLAEGVLLSSRCPSIRPPGAGQHGKSCQRLCSPCSCSFSPGPYLPRPLCSVFTVIFPLNAPWKKQQRRAFRSGWAKAIKAD